MDQVAPNETVATDAVTSALRPSPESGLGRTLLGFAGDVLLLLLLTVAAAFVALAPLMLAKVDLDAYLLLVIAVTFVAMALAAWPLWRRSRQQAGLRPALTLGSSLGFASLVGVVAFALSVSKSWLQPHLIGDVPEPSNIAPILSALSSQPWLAMGLFVVLGPWVEELMLRRVLFGRMLVRGWPWLGLLLTTTLFAWLHEPVLRDDLDVGQWLWLLSGYWLIGALFAWVYWRTRRLSAAFVAHAINNLLACGVLLLGPG